MKLQIICILNLTQSDRVHPRIFYGSIFVTVMFELDVIVSCFVILYVCVCMNWSPCLL